MDIILRHNNKELYLIKVSDLKLTNVLNKLSGKLPPQKEGFYALYLNYCNENGVQLTTPSKIGYIVAEGNYILTAQEDILLWTIEKFNLNKIVIDLVKNSGYPISKFTIKTIREEISMGDNAVSKNFEISSETKMSDLVELQNYKLYKKTTLEFFNKFGQKMIINIRNNQKLVFDDITFSKFVFMQDVDLNKQVVLYQKK